MLGRVHSVMSWACRAMRQKSLKMFLVGSENRFMPPFLYFVLFFGVCKGSGNVVDKSKHFLNMLKVHNRIVELLRIEIDISYSFGYLIGFIQYWTVMRA